MAEIKALFWDNGGVIPTNGWDRHSRRAAVDKFQLDWNDFEDRHELMLDAFETARASIDDYLHRTIFYRERSFSSADFKTFMFDHPALSRTTRVFGTDCQVSPISGGISE